jgi:hypothetical protein
MTPTPRLAVLCSCAALYSHPALAQTAASRPLADRAAAVGRLLGELRTPDYDGDERYRAIREDYTSRTWGEVDAFVTEAVSPRTSADAVKADLDMLLGHKRGDLIRNRVFPVVLATGRFLVTALEMRRTAGAFSDDAFSIRAYRESGNGFTLVAHTEIEQQFDPRATDLSDLGPTHYLHAMPFPSRPAGAEFWLMFWASASARQPPLIAVRLVTFDGYSLRTLWAPPNIQGDDDKAIEATPDGFIVRSLVDPSSTERWSSTPSVVVREQYVLTVDGPQKVNEWRTPERDEPR